MTNNDLVDTQVLTDRWSNKQNIPVEAIFNYLNRNLGAEKYLSREETWHVADLLHALFLWSTEGQPVGDFLSAVIDDRLSRAVLYADGTNRKALWLYPMFLNNVPPHDWKTRFRDTENEE